MKYVIAMLISLYQMTLSLLLPKQCRFVPSCSEYAKESFLKKGTLKGCWYMLSRLMRCHPWSEGGIDPVR
ncbi:MAG: membrane protein insertion efficiency factor YidD [Deltaproteobacteria bacterium]|nr:membrane protein insertion efficiency factor YidD [Deltaproteobacteria bacterium]